jgi:hypothetical protein
MWYRLALTTIDPTGQINFPDMGGHKFDLNNLSFNVTSRNYPSAKSFTIFAKIPAFKYPIGHLDFIFDKQTNIIDIQGVLIQKLGRDRFNFLKENHNDEVQIKTTGIGIGKKLYQKFLEVVQNDEELSKADYVRGLVHSQQAYKAKNNALGKPFSITSKFHSFKERDEVQDKIYDLESKLEESDINFIEKNQILQSINKLKNQLKKSAPVSHDESLNILVPASWSKEGGYSDHLFDFPNVETKHKIPTKNSIKPNIRLQNPAQLSLDVSASKKHYKIAQSLLEIHPAEQEALNLYGETKNPSKAGYILSNGKLLDFSEGGDERSLDHRNIENVMEAPENSYGDRYRDYVQPFMDSTGAIRMHFDGVWNVDIYARPTNEQITAIAKHHRNGRDFIYECDPLDDYGVIENASQSAVFNKLKEIQKLLGSN